MLVLYIPSILWGIESGEGDFALQQAWAGLCTLEKWRLLINQPSQLMTLLSVRKRRAKGARFQGSDCGTSAAAALTYTLAMVARSPSNSTCQAHALQRVLPWRSLWSWWTTAWGASAAPLLLTSRIVHFHPPAHLLALSDQQDPSSPQPGNTNTITCSELNRITEISSCCHFMFNILLLPQSRQG